MKLLFQAWTIIPFIKPSCYNPTSHSYSSITPTGQLEPFQISVLLNQIMLPLGKGLWKPSTESWQGFFRQLVPSAPQPNCPIFWIAPLPARQQTRCVDRQKLQIALWMPCIGPYRPPLCQLCVSAANEIDIILKSPNPVRESEGPKELGEICLAIFQDPLLKKVQSWKKWNHGKWQ